MRGHRQLLTIGLALAVVASAVVLLDIGRGEELPHALGSADKAAKKKRPPPALKTRPMNRRTVEPRGPNEREGTPTRLEEPATDGSSSRLVFNAAPGEGESWDTLQWSKMSQEERVAHLSSEFDLALEAETEEGIAHAESALSVLRGELYETQEGRDLHVAMERRLEEVTESP